MSLDPPHRRGELVCEKLHEERVSKLLLDFGAHVCECLGGRVPGRRDVGGKLEYGYLVKKRKMGGLQTCPDEGGRRRCDETEDEKVKDSLATEEEARDGVKEGRNNDGRDSPDTTRGVRGVVVGVRYLFFPFVRPEGKWTSIGMAGSPTSHPRFPRFPRFL